MLYLQRKVGQKIIIEGDIEVEVIDITGNRVRLGFKFPEGRSVLRQEILDRAKANGTEAQLFLDGLM